MSTSASLSIDTALDEITLGELAPALTRGPVARYITDQRWFGDKSRRVAVVAPVTWSVTRLGDEIIFLLVVRVTFDSGDPVDYFVPLVASKSSARRDPIASVTAVDGEWVVTDAVSVEVFRQWLLSSLLTNASDSSGMFRWTSQLGAPPVINEAQGMPSRASSAQQSNSSIIYGSHVMLKVFRRLSSGLNPEVELGRFLTSETSFRNTPALLGEWSLSVPDQPSLSLGVAQTFVPNVGDGWSFTLESVRSNSQPALGLAGRLGQVTAGMHLALESAERDSDLLAERIDESDANGWKTATSRAIDETASALAAVAGQYSGGARDLIDTFLTRVKPMAARLDGYDELIGCTKTRVHGDYHLGQTLRTDDDFVILDFEGEPQRSIAERRQKTSPLKDVAGMLRSFGYARGVLERENPEMDVASLITWERVSRRAFIDEYVKESRKGGCRYLPASDDDVRQAIAAWELDKALYEVRYELNSRPDWLPLPLAATLKLA